MKSLLLVGNLFTKRSYFELENEMNLISITLDNNIQR